MTQMQRVTQEHAPSGLGEERSAVRFCVANRPPLADYRQLQGVRPLQAGEIAHIVAHTSNHWRKLFNVLAKVMFALPRRGACSRWQDYREQNLLQAGGAEQLLFSAPCWQTGAAIHIVTGKTYAATLNLPPLTWLDESFAINRQFRVVVSPYPDYRQLSNARIEQLVALVTPMLPEGRSA